MSQIPHKLIKRTNAPATLWNKHFHLSISILRLGCFRVTFYKVGSPMLCRTPAPPVSLACASTSARPQIHSVLTHSYNVYRLSLLSSGNRKVCDGCDTGQARCTWPYRLSHRLRKTVVISSMPIFCSCGADDVSSHSFVPHIKRMNHATHLR